MSASAQDVRRSPFRCFLCSWFFVAAATFARPATVVSDTGDRPPVGTLAAALQRAVADPQPDDTVMSDPRTAHVVERWWGPSPAAVPKQLPVR